MLNGSQCLHHVVLGVFFVVVVFPCVQCVLSFFFLCLICCIFLVFLQSRARQEDPEQLRLKQKAKEVQ